MQRRTFAAAGLLTIGMCLGGASRAAAQGYPGATAPQIRACRTEADRRLPDYTYDQIVAESESRDQNVAVVRWTAGGTDTGTCTVATNGRILGFTRDRNFSGDRYGGPSTRVTCESKRTEREECRVPPGSRIRLIRQISDNPCRPNDTYGQGQGYIWVAEGCRAEFEVMAPNYGGPGGPAGGSTRLTCSAPINGRQECPLPANTVAKFVSQVGNRPCRLNETFGIGFGHVWVSNGCRGEFEVTVGGGQSGPSYPGTGTGLPTRVTCESSNGQRNECRIRNGAQVQLVKQLSTSACVRNSSWGTEYGVLWVDKGCRGEFEVR